MLDVILAQSSCSIRNQPWKFVRIIISIIACMYHRVLLYLVEIEFDENEFD